MSENPNHKLLFPSLLLSMIGASVGYLFSLLFALPGDVLCGPRLGGGPSLWAASWMLIGALQGACVAPAWTLAATETGPSRLALSLGGFATTMVALQLWVLLGRDGCVSLLLGAGMLLLCAAPLCAYLCARRSVCADLPAGGL